MRGKKGKGQKNREYWDRDRAEPCGIVQICILAALKVPIFELAKKS